MEEETTAPDETGGILEVGVDPATNEVCVNVPACEQIDGFWHLTFSPDQARNFAHLLLVKADLAEVGV